MADTSIFEVVRQTHEEVERYTQAAVDVLAASAAGSSSSASASASTSATRESLRRQHQISQVLDRIVSRNASLHGLYRDSAGYIKRESDLIHEVAKGGAAGGADGMEEFYARLAKVRDYHKKYPNETPDVFSVDLDTLGTSGQRAPEAEASSSSAGAGVFDPLDQLFSGEEMGGRFLDLYLYHDVFLNLKGVRRITYLQYLDTFDKLRGDDARVPVEAKRTEAYRRYLQDLQTYLLQFLRRTRPLADIDALEIIALAGFEEDWEQGKIPGWEDQGESVLNLGSRAAASASTAVAEGIWCEACKRSFAKQTVFDAHLKGAKHVKAAERLASGQGRDGGERGTNGQADPEALEVERTKRQARAKAIARDETVIAALGTELLSVRAETRANVERKAALTERERQAEAEAAAAEVAARAEGAADGNENDDEEGEERIYNPLKLPLGWDGRPIPFWLYKLHGLSAEFTCEICSDYKYQGRKNFERHFSESRHAFGMRALGLPNTKHFYEITRIEDALALADKLKRQGKLAAEERDDAEEVEDEHGNTYTRKTYDLLKRQGLI